MVVEINTIIITILTPALSVHALDALPTTTRVGRNSALERCSEESVLHPLSTHWWLGAISWLSVGHFGSGEVLVFSGGTTAYSAEGRADFVE